MSKFKEERLAVSVREGFVPVTLDCEEMYNDYPVKAGSTYYTADGRAHIDDLVPSLFTLKEGVEFGFVTQEQVTEALKSLPKRVQKSLTFSTVGPYDYDLQVTTRYQGKPITVPLIHEFSKDKCYKITIEEIETVK